MSSRPRITGKDIIKYTLEEYNIDYQVEYKFNSKRRFRFDYYFEIGGKRIGVEYDGLFSDKSRHTTVSGFSRDTEKTNLAALDGFIVLRYTAMTVSNFREDLLYLLMYNKS